ncbi:hypothetical protein [Subtercola sp. PAMC28395]|uniref:hypothetical protein n=1 Tax=Subtercola sp. PAMC28395 TaxID=2846775 RepID=UPI00209AE2FF|nr:hypothetical protein [Subtercola sp. PAMC28395]
MSEDHHALPDDDTSSPNPSAAVVNTGATLSSTPILMRALRVAALLTVVLVVVGGVVGYFLDGWVGVVSAVIGAAMAFVFLAITATSILIANRYYASPLFTTLFFAIVLGAWLLKFVLFIIAALLLRNQPWTNNGILFTCLIIGVIGTLVVDVVVVARSRMPYASDAKLP